MKLNRHQGSRYVLRAATVVAAIGATVGVAGCTSEAESAPVTCSEIVKTAAFETDVEDEIRGLDDAIVQCDSYDQLYGEMTSYQRIVGYSVEEFLQRRCRDESERLGKTEVCQVAVPPTTVPELSKDLAYTGKTLDGNLVTVTPAEEPFDGDVPERIAETVRAAEDGCVAVLGARNDYAFFADQSRKGQIMSMYAQHAQDVAYFLGCVVEPLPIPGAPVASVPPTTQP